MGRVKQAKDLIVSESLWRSVVKSLDIVPLHVNTDFRIYNYRIFSIRVVVKESKTGFFRSMKMSVSLF